MIHIGIDIDYSERTKREYFSYCIIKQTDEIEIIKIDTIVNYNVYRDNLPSDRYLEVLNSLYPNAVIIKELK